MREIFKNILSHTYALGFITELKVTGEDDSTLIETIDENNRVVIKGHLTTPIADLKGEFGVGRLGVLKGIIDYPNIKADGSTTEIVYKDRNGVNVPDKIIFKDANGAPWDHRFMSAELVREQVDFRGVEWTVEVMPTSSEIQDFAYKTGVYSADEKFFTVKAEGGELRFYIGENGGTYTAIKTEKPVKFKSSHKWPFAEVIKVLKINEGKSLVSIYDAPKMGAMQITVETTLAKWLYIFPAATE